MRIRQVRPEFFTDARVSRLSTDVRLTYIGLWCVADDAGWMDWDVPQIAAQLYPYESVRVRERRIEKAGAALTDAGRLRLEECGCALIPKLADHQKIGGNKAFGARDRHQKHVQSRRVHTVPDESARNVRVGNGTVSEVRLEARERARDETDPALIAAFRRQGLPVDAA